MSKRTHCVQGHEFTPENTYVYTYKKSGYTKRWCKRCRGINGGAAYHRNPIKDWSEEEVKQRHEYERGSRLLRTYGISAEQYDLMFAKQGGLCAICHQPERTKKKKLSVDHNHKTQIVRKLLCHHCNSLLGHAEDKIETLQSAIQYIKDWSTP
jgi:phage FluMu protein Com